MDLSELTKSFHQQSANTPENWQRSAQLLIAAFGAIGRNIALHTENQMHGIVAVQAMLLGFAIECLLKGKWVADDNRLTGTEGDFINVPNAGKHHGLVQLADAVKFDLSRAERSALARLTPFVQWAGRYPIPNNWEQMLSTNVPGRGKIPPTFISASELETAEKVFWQLANKVPIGPKG